MADVKFDPEEQWSRVFGYDDRRPVRGIRLSEEYWKDIHISPPRDQITTHTMPLHDLELGMIVCVDKGDENIRKYAYLFDVNKAWDSGKLMPCHVNAKTIYVPNPYEYDTNFKLNRFEQKIDEEVGNAEVIRSSVIDLYPVSDEWLIQEIDRTELVVSQII